jgi:signal transduction histidine kinase
VHASLAELLEHLKPRLLRVARDGQVRCANSVGQTRTGSATGRRLSKPKLLRDVERVVVAQSARVLHALGSPLQDGDAPPELKYGVTQDLARDDAFVPITQASVLGEGVGHDNLMRAIRADLRDPLREVRAALQAAEGRGEFGDEEKAVLDRVDHLLCVLDRLVDLVSLWDSNAPMANDRIELWPLLQQAWGHVEPLALERGVKVRFRAQTDAGALATLYGSEHWMGRVFQECLEAAVRSTRRGRMLDIEHRQLGARAMVVFRDCAVFAARRLDGVELPASKKSKTAAATRPLLLAKEQIGFKLCQRIVSLHGGQLREEEDGQRNFLIDLPTGAPARNDQSQLDIAQAERYAHDLAALMTRARVRRETANARDAVSGKPASN